MVFLASANTHINMLLWYGLLSVTLHSTYLFITVRDSGRKLLKEHAAD